ncbi:hypothetical protein Bache_1513 [Bacteroides helcogenes P 36-108]|uniref:Uncharacterized protein n=1 Tax=Bacteroides helcogenes (strain ATCC 35417 / DSM 20613 / JCM 6297 / CCUG 15421 / P 36-108) TaxID=693979 RepID=E6SVQ7_BACT6|nr:hypothetical protein Bache_1513 [Bacteroides helcogenes P 36-108]
MCQKDIGNGYLSRAVFPYKGRGSIDSLSPNFHLVNSNSLYLGKGQISSSISISR